jgi:hypothetical protein
MRISIARRWYAVVGAVAAPLTFILLTGALPPAAARSTPCPDPTRPASQTCADSAPHDTAAAQPLPAGDAPAFLMASVQPITAPAAWRRIYQEVERCAGMKGTYDEIRWSVMEAPLQGPKGPTFAFTVGPRIVMVRNDTTYLRHEMLHHILEVAGWQPRTLKPGEHYSIADLHPMPLFGLCTGGR